MASTIVNRPKAFEAKTSAAAQQMLPHHQATTAAEHLENYEYAKRQSQALYAHDADVEYPDCYQIWYDVCQSAKSDLDKAKAREAEANRPKAFEAKTFAAAQRMLPHPQAKSAAEHEENFACAKQHGNAVYAYDAACYRIWYDVCKTVKSLLDEAKAHETEAKLAREFAEKMEKTNDPGANALIKQKRFDDKNATLEAQLAIERTAREVAEQMLRDLETRLQESEKRLQDSDDLWQRRVLMEVRNAESHLKDIHNQEIAALKEGYEREIAELKTQRGASRDDS